MNARCSFACCSLARCSLARCVNARRRWGRTGVGLALLCLPAWLAAQDLAPAASVPASALPGTAWFDRIQRAATRLSYQGTLMFSSGGVVSSSKVVHVCEGRDRFERIEVLDGRPRLQYRHNDQLMTLWPGSRKAIVEPIDGVAEFPSLPGAPGLDPLASYQVSEVGSGRIAGHQAEVLSLAPRDALRFGHRLWVDRQSGLLLRSDVLGPLGEVLESAAFTDLRIGGRLQSEPILAAMRRLDGYRVVRRNPVKTALEHEGWNLAHPVAGYRLVDCSKRTLEAAAADGPALQVLQSVYSDGLSHVSVFIEPFDADRHKQPMRTSLGASHTLTNRHGDWWLTIVGEVPMTTVLQFEAMLERRR